jgi:pentose-5-phosphate-3-epimerase
MSVVPGFQGSKFLPETLDKIEELRHFGYQSDIYLDGGINVTTLPLIYKRNHRPDFLCIGSYLTKSMNIAKSVKDLYTLIEENSQ